MTVKLSHLTIIEAKLIAFGPTHFQLSIISFLILKFSVELVTAKYLK